MVTTTCKLTLGEKSVTGRVSVSTPYQDGHVIYSGQVELIPRDRRFTTAAPPLLRILFKNLARELHANVAINDEGNYDVEE
ncbi:MAG TPA: hypothetical protein VN281_05185 [Verrucomicrobiae bacterium]|jgi:hypothetical protein|nr:hypothetical protein [Verrucomicrobiae bacterium]